MTLKTEMIDALPPDCFLRNEEYPDLGEQPEVTEEEAAII